jgi:chromosome transmission fidelity protein 1
VTDALHDTLQQLFAAAPGGVVVFFTSFAYMEALVQRWRAAGKLRALDCLKTLFVETREPPGTNSNSNGSKNNNGNNGRGESVWSAYCARIAAATQPGADPRGAALFSVIGGKLSEGINFSDDLARCLCVPYISLIN